MENKNKNIAIGVVVAVLVLAIVFIAWKAHQASAPVSPVVDNTQIVPTPTEDVSTGSVNSGSSAVSLSYTEALVKYAKARLQLDDRCQADAGSQKMTFKNNSYLMIDNRASVARTVHVGSVFTVKAYGFKIVKLSSASLPATWLVDCDSSQNIATITLQK